MELIDDLVKIKQLDDQNYQRVLEAMSDDREGLEWSLLIKEISKQCDEESIKAVIRFLNFVSDNVSDSRNYSNEIKEIDEFLAKLLNGEPKALEGWERVKGSLDKLQSYFLQKKEKSIKDKFSRITSFKIITDIRPIFSMDKKNISKLTFPNILKIETSDEKEFICEFYEDSIDKLIEELEVAKNKINLMKEIYSGN